MRVFSYLKVVQFSVFANKTKVTDTSLSFSDYFEHPMRAYGLADFFSTHPPRSPVSGTRCPVLDLKLAVVPVKSRRARLVKNNSYSFRVVSCRRENRGNTYRVCAVREKSVIGGRQQDRGDSAIRDGFIYGAGPTRVIVGREQQRVVSSSITRTAAAAAAVTVYSRR